MDTMTNGGQMTASVWIAEKKDSSEIYFVADGSVVKADYLRLVFLVKEIHGMFPNREIGWNLERVEFYNERGIKRYLKRQKKGKGQYIPGKIWLHPDLMELKMDIARVLTGKQQRITDQLPLATQ